jgi:hypothetical protein
MAKRPIPTPNTLRQLLRYDPATGKLFWKMRQGDTINARRLNSRFAGKQAFANERRGYAYGRVEHKCLAAHRVAWAIHYGEWPCDQIDHINGDGSDNRICNLRDVSSKENNRNQRTPKNNSSGFIGVGWDACAKKWRARISYGGSEKTLGKFARLEDAVAARCQAEIDHGYHPNHGRSA